MKIFAVILAITLFGGSVKGTPLVKALQSVVLSGMQCDHESSKDSCHHSEEGTDNCCGEMDCECTCCVHIMIFSPLTAYDFQQESFGESRDSYKFNYFRDYSSKVIHPPTLV